MLRILLESYPYFGYGKIWLCLILYWLSSTDIFIQHANNTNFAGFFVIRVNHPVQLVCDYILYELKTRI